MLVTTLTSLAITICPTGLSLSIPEFVDIDLTSRHSTTSRPPSPLCWELHLSPHPSTGETTKPSPLSRTKEAADHAGHSLPLDASKVLMPSNLVNFFLSLSNNSLTVTQEMLDVMVVSKKMHSNTLESIMLTLKKITHTREETKLASTPIALLRRAPESRSTPGRPSPPTMPLR